MSACWNSNCCKERFSVGWCLKKARVLAEAAPSVHKVHSSGPSFTAWRNLATLQYAFVLQTYIHTYMHTHSHMNVIKAKWKITAGCNHHVAQCWCQIKSFYVCCFCWGWLILSLAQLILHRFTHSTSVTCIVQTTRLKGPPRLTLGFEGLTAGAADASRSWGDCCELTWYISLSY